MARELYRSLPFVDRMVLRLGVAFHRKIVETRSLRRIIPVFLVVSILFGIAVPVLNRKFVPGPALVGLSLWSVGVSFALGLALLLYVSRSAWPKNGLIFVSVVCFAAFIFFFGTGLLLNNFFGKFISLEDAWTFSLSLAFAVGFALTYLVTYGFRTSALYSVLLFLPIYVSPFLPFPEKFFHTPVQLYLSRSMLITALLSFDLTVIFAVIDNIIRSNLEIGGMELFNSMLAFLSGRREELERAFLKMGKKVETYAGLVALRTKLEKILFLAPSIHPGPFAGVGGADMSSRLQRALGGWEVFNFHGPSTHDLDPANGNEIDKVAATVRGSLRKMKFGSKKVGRLFRASEGNMAVASQLLGMPFMVSYRVNEICEDIDAAVGAAIIEDGAILVDAHNRLSPEDSSGFWKSNLYSNRKHYFEDVLDYGKRTTFDLFSLHARIMPRYNKPHPGRLMAGSAKVAFRNEGIGPEGIKAAVVQVGSQRTAYILVDGNNMVTGLREEVANAVADLVDEVLVTTTDSHAVNDMMGGLNPVGERMSENERKKFLLTCRSLVEEAAGNLSPATCSADILRISDLTVLGPGRTAEIMSAVRSIAALSKALVPVTVVTLFVLALIVLVST